MAPPILGEIKLLASGTAPAGWAFCNGQVLPITQNQELFSLLGTTFGGNGQTTFALPDLRGRVPLHTGGGIAFGSAGGEEQHTLTLAQLALHTHTVVADATPAPAADGNLPGLTRRLAGSTGGNLYGPPNNLVPMNAAAISSVGAGLGHVNLQPFLAINFIIALQGRFPVRRRAFIRNIMYIVRGLFGNRG